MIRVHFFSRRKVLCKLLTAFEISASFYFGFFVGVAMLSDTVSPDELDSDGFFSWESFYGSDNVELVGTLLEMYDVLMGRTPQDLLKPDKGAARLEGVIHGKDVPDRGGNWSSKVERNWNCRCSGKSISDAVTRCASCHTNIESEIRSTDLREGGKMGSVDVLNCQSVPERLDDKHLDKCELVTCPAGFSTPTTPVQARMALHPRLSPLSYKRNASSESAGEGDFVCVTRPLSVSSIASSSSSSSSSGASSCSGARRLGIPHKSLVYLASIESLEDDSDSERQMQKNEKCGLALFKCNGSQGSEDSGVHSPCSYVSSPSPPEGRPRYCDPDLSYMDRVVMEIIETEEVYVRDLQKIIEGYLKKWRSQPDFPLLDRLNDLFGNIEAIYSFNSLFLRELEQCGLDPVKIAQCFVRHNAGFSVYTEYCTNYPRTVSSLTELMRQEGTARLFRERQTALQHTLPLGSYLLKPVQRILKYHLLLENIVKQYSNGYEGYKDIQDALRTMTEIAQHINDMKRRHEHEVRVQEIQSLLYGWEGEDLTTFGELCAEGAFRMHGAKAPRHVFLFDKMVLITKEKEGGILDYKTHINSSNLMLIESVPGEPLSFHVIPFDNPKHQYTLQARNLEQKREWTLQLKRVILENYDAVIPSHARQLVMELGQNRRDDEIMADKSLPRRQHSAPEYLEKRKQGRRNSETVLKSKLKKMRIKTDIGDTLLGQYKNQRNFRQNGFIGLSDGQVNPRRKSEPGLYSGKKKDGVGDAHPGEKNVFVAPEKLDEEEMKTLEQVVAQILKQNAEFDKVLRRQQHSISIKKRLRSGERSPEDQKDGGEYEALVSVELVVGNEEDEARLVPGNDTEATKFCRQNSLREGRVTQSNSIRRSKSFQSNEEKLISSVLAKVSLDSAPTSPSVWLRQQEPHLATPSNKAGSLPRSFQINSDSDPNDPRSFRDFKISIERPFTIASDTVPSKMLLDDMYSISEKSQCCDRSIQGDTTEDESLTETLSTPGASSDKINFHPDYKIYRSSLSTSIIKNVLTTVHNKLSQVTTTAVTKTGGEKSKALQKERKAGRVVWMIAKHYNKTLRQRHKTKKPLSIIEDTALMYRQGSPNLGERLAHFSDVERRVKPTRKAASLLGVRPDSVLSMSSSTASVCERIPDGDRGSPDASEDETDGFYERSFEAIDDEELRAESSSEEEEVRAKVSTKVPPPVPVKPRHGPRSSTSDPEMRRGGEEEGDTSSQHSTASTVIEIREESDGVAGSRQKGWVRHVVGKFQGECK